MLMKDFSDVANATKQESFLKDQCCRLFNILNW